MINKNIIILALYVFSLSTVSAQTNIVITDVRIKAVNVKTGLDVIVNNLFHEVFSKSYGIINVVERDYIDEVGFIRKFFLQGTNIKGSNLQGAEYSVNSTFSNYHEKMGSNVYTNPENKEKRTTHYTMSISFKLDVEIVDVESGEVVLKEQLTPNGWAYMKNIGNKEDIKKLLIRKAYIDMSYGLEKALKYDFYHFLQPEFEVLNISEVSGKKAIKLLTLGTVANKYYSDFIVFKKVVVEFGGKSINRTKAIGKVKLESVFHRNSEFLIKEGKEEILKAFSAGNTLVLKHAETIFYPNASTKYRKDQKKQYESEKPKPPKPKAVVSEKDKKRAKMKKKKVKRKKK